MSGYYFYIIVFILRCDVKLCRNYYLNTFKRDLNEGLCEDYGTHGGVSIVRKDIRSFLDPFASGIIQKTLNDNAIRRF